jgi:uncharacterized protein YwgA
MERKHWTLLVIDEAGLPGLSPVQLQKILFLIGRNLPTEVGNLYYEFVPYNYGPFDSRVYSDAQHLVNQGLVQMIQVAGRNWSYYAITETGSQMAQHIRETEINDRTAKYITTVVKWVQSLSFAQLLAAIYQQYPEFKAKSVFVA